MSRERTLMTESTIALSKLQQYRNVNIVCPCSSSHQITNVLKKLFKWSQSDYKKNFGDERNVGIVSVCWN